jgi:hypothetical protein
VELYESSFTKLRKQAAESPNQLKENELESIIAGKQLEIEQKNKSIEELIQLFF